MPQRYYGILGRGTSHALRELIHDKRNSDMNLQDYMLDFYKDKNFAGKKVLEIGCGAGH